MDNYKDLQEMLIDMSREIRDLKTAHSLSPSVKTFYATITPTSTNPITITYGDGNNDIITDVYTDSDALLGVVNSNTQKINFFSQAQVDVIVASTRPIISLAQS